MFSSRAVHEEGHCCINPRDYIKSRTGFSELMPTFSMDAHLNSCALHPLQDKVHSTAEGKGENWKSHMDIRGYFLQLKIYLRISAVNFQ